MIKLYHLINARSQRVIWLLEELSLDYELIVCEREDGLAPKWLKEIHPVGKVPILIDEEDNNQTTMAESAAIVDYVIARFGKGRLTSDKEDAQFGHYLFWKNYIEGTLVPDLVLKQIFYRLVCYAPWPAKWLFRLIKRQFDQRYLDSRIETHLQMLEEHLATFEWLGGNNMTAADILVSFCLEAIFAGNEMFSRQYPVTHAYFTRLQDRPAYQTAKSKGQWSKAEHATYWRVAW